MKKKIFPCIPVWTEIRNRKARKIKFLTSTELSSKNHSWTKKKRKQFIIKSVSAQILLSVSCVSLKSNSSSFADVEMVLCMSSTHNEKKKSIFTSSQRWPILIKTTFAQFKKMKSATFGRFQVMGLSLFGIESNL